MPDLEKSREEINSIDARIAELFERRMDVAQDIAVYKKQFGLQVYDAAREQEVLDREVSLIKNPDYRPYYLDFLRSMMAVSKKYQHRIVSGSRVAFCGVQGAWADIAARRIFPKGVFVSYPDFAKAYASVVAGQCDFAVLPVENSYAGNVGQVFDLMHSGPLYINGMYSLRISQALLGVKGSSLSDVKKVMSHQQALDQCMPFIRENGFSVQAVANTAFAARDVASMGDRSVAAIASEESAAIYGLEVLKRGINEASTNTTRFAVFSPVKIEDIPSGSDSLFQMVFSVRDVPGALANAISAFSEAGINLRSLQSRPVGDVPWKYYFYVEGEGSLLSDEGRALVAKLEQSCEEVKILGHYLGDISI